MSTRLRFACFAAAFSLGICGCTPHTDPMARWRDLGTLETLEKSSPGTVPDAIKQDAKAYFQTTPPDDPPDEAYMGPLDRYLEDGTGQHAVVVEVPRQGERWQYALIYDRNNRRIKVLRYSVGAKLLSRGNVVAEPQSAFSRYIAKVGVWSYSIYLLHMPILLWIAHVLHEYLPPKLGSGFSAFCVLMGSWLVIVPLAGLWYKVFEMPSNELGRRFVRWLHPPAVPLPA